MPLIQAVIQGFLLLMLLGCGYQLSPPSSLQGVAVSVGSSVDPAVLRLLQLPVGAGRAEADSDAAAGLSLMLHEEIYQKFPIAAAAFDETTEFEVALRWVFSVKDGGGDILIDAERLTVTAHLTRHNQRLVAASETEAVLQAQLRAELARQLRDRVQPWLTARGSK